MLSTGLERIAATPEAWYEVACLFGMHPDAYELWIQQIMASGQVHPDFEGGYREELERARTCGVPAGVKVSVFNAARDGRETAELMVREPLQRSTFDWLLEGYERFDIDIQGFNSLSATVVPLLPLQLTVNKMRSGSTEAQEESRLMDQVESILRRFELPEPPPPPFVVVMGHGNDNQWRVLRDELRDHHEFIVDAFEGRPRAGQTISMVLEDMAANAGAAVLVLTRADQMADGAWRGRQNVIHEVGFFQGRLGWTNAIVVAEEGVELPSNLDGTQQVRYPEGHIQAATGHLAATLNLLRKGR